MNKSLRESKQGSLLRLNASIDYAILLTDMIGQSLITHVDRSKRANIDESIDTICWQGTCSCAETTCTVRCAQCRGIDKSRLRAELCAPQSFGEMFFRFPN